MIYDKEHNMKSSQNTRGSLNRSVLLPKMARTSSDISIRFTLVDSKSFKQLGQVRNASDISQVEFYLDTLESTEIINAAPSYDNLTWSISKLEGVLTKVLVYINGNPFTIHYNTKVSNGA